MFKKTILLIIVICLLTGSISACQDNSFNKNIQGQKNKEMTRDKQIAYFLKENFPYLGSVYYRGQVEEYKTTIDIFEKKFITDNGEIYKQGHFSDGSTMRKIDSEVYAERFFYGCVVDEGNNLYYHDEETNCLKNNPFDVLYQRAPLGLRGQDYIDMYLVDQTDNGDYYSVMVNDDALQLFVNDVRQEGILFQFEKDETIEYIVDGTIKTNKRYYWLEVVPKVSEFDDVKTTYSCVVHPIEMTIEGIRFIKHCPNPSMSPCVYLIDDEGNLYEGLVLNDLMDETNLLYDLNFEQ